MAKRSVMKTAIGEQSESGGEAPKPRQPCPCGSGKRYKACHGRAGWAEDVIVTRPFEGLAAECQLAALREFVPSATAPMPLAASVVPEDRQVKVASVLPMAAAAVVRQNGAGQEALIGLQTQARSGDLSRDLARALRWAFDAAPGDVLPVVGTSTANGEQVRLQDLLDAGAALDVTVHEDFGWWMTEEQEATADLRGALDHANQAIVPTAPIRGAGVDAAYWVDAGEKAHLRWVRPEPEGTLLSAMARLAAADGLSLGEGSRYVGSFRAHGLLVPVWDLNNELHHREWSEPAERFAGRLTTALESLPDTPLTAAERRTLAGLRGRQITVR